MKQEEQERVSQAIPDPTPDGAEERMGETLPGASPPIPPSFYYCSKHEERILAQDVVWIRDEPHCPNCGFVLERWVG